MVRFGELQDPPNSMFTDLPGGSVQSGQHAFRLDNKMALFAFSYTFVLVHLIKKINQLVVKFGRLIN